MTKFFKLFFLFCTISSIAFGQKQNLILTGEQNTKWIDSLKTLTLDQQLITIKDRLLSDTNVFVRQYYNDGIRVVDPIGSRVYGDGKPTLVIGTYPIIIDNKTKTHKIIELTKLLTNDFIKNISILSPNHPGTTAIYGLAGRSGVIIMTLTNKKHLKKFRRLSLKSNGYRYT